MKHIKKFENMSKDIKIGDWVVAYRPVNIYDKTKIIIDNNECVIDYGKVIDTNPYSNAYKSNSKQYYPISFKNNGTYFRENKHILYVADDEDDAQYVAMKQMAVIIDTNKYNI